MLENLKAKFDVLLAAVSTELATLGDSSKVALGAAWKIVQESVAQAVLVIEAEIGDSLSGPEKKQAAMDYVGQVIDMVTKFIDIPYVPEWVEGILDKYLKMLLLQIASGSIDAIVSTFHSTGVFPPVKKVEG
jgi:hypothetical protein